MRVVLISLPAPFESEPAMNPPLGLAYIAANLREVTSDIQAIDFTCFPQYDYYKSKRYLQEIPLDGDLYCISCTTPQFHWLVEVTEYVKQNTSGEVIVGGPHATTRAKECLDIAKVDYVMRGEGDKAIVDLVNDVDPTLIEGLNFIDGDEYIEKSRSYIRDLDSLPFPGRDVFNLAQYKRKIYEYQAIHLITLRGCPYNCAFCDRESVGRVLRYRSIQNVMQEIDLLVGQYGVRAFVIYDDIFTLSRERVLEFCYELKLRKLMWRCWSRADTLDEEKLVAMKEAGLTSITIGIESGSDTILTNIKKGATAEDNRKALLLCKRLDVPVRCSLMYGNPGETRKTIEETLMLIKETQPDEWNLAILTPIPGSDIWNRPEAYGITYNQDLAKKNRYKQCNRFGNTGIGSVSITLDTMTEQEFQSNLEYFVHALEEVCPRRKIQDTIQNIKL